MKISGEEVGSQLLLFVGGDDAAAAMRALPVALLEVGARVSDLFTTVLARHCDMLVFRHAARITESWLECTLVSAGGELARRMFAKAVELDPKIPDQQITNICGP
jgi:hypothetical protein